MVKEKVFLQVKLHPIFAFWRDGADRLSPIKKLPQFIQKGKQRWEDIAWKQAAEENYEVVDPKEGKAEVEDVYEVHPSLLRWQ